MPISAPKQMAQLSAENKGIKRKRSTNNQKEWVDTVLRKGTIADKLAAHVLLVHESRDWSSLDALIEMVDPFKCRRQCVMAMSTVKELFLESLNFTNPKNQQEFSDDEKVKIRFYYAKFVDHLNSVASDNLEETRKKAIFFLSELLQKYHDNKEYILEKLINKMGDKVPKIAAAAGRIVERAVNHQREDLRLRTIKYVQKFLSRPKKGSRARFYAVSLLSRIKLIKENHDIANILMQTYLELYITLMKENETESKLMTSILAGIHRAYPYSRLKNEVFEQHLQALYKLVHQVNFKMRVVAMNLIKNIVTKRAQLLKCPVEDRFYNLVFGQLIQPELQTCSRQQAFAKLLLNVLNEDTVLERKEAFVKRMLQVALNSQPEFALLLLTTITNIKGVNTAELCTNSKDDDMIEEDNSVDADDDSDDDGSGDGDDSGSLSNDDGGSVDMVVGSSWVHNRNIRPQVTKTFDLLARNPRAAKPEHLNELLLLRHSFDPAVAEAARKLMNA